MEELQREHLEQLLEFVISGLEMGSVMISTIIEIVTMMVEIAVDLM